MIEAPAAMSGFLVVDASVSLKWALDDEEAVTQAVALRDAALAGSFRMVAPSLWLYELTNGLVSAVRRGRLTQEVGVEALSSLLGLGVELADPEATDVFEHAFRFGLAAYDSAYVALAHALGAQLWTGDRRFYEAASDRSTSVRWIGDYR